MVTGKFVEANPTALFLLLEARFYRSGAFASC
jgi:hypothetical protein